MSFPCDPQGHVEIDRLSERVRENYFFGRTVVGCDYAAPVVMRARAAREFVS
jgi:hypothetical protein